MKNTLIALSIASIFSCTVLATEVPVKEAVSPSDLTQTNTFVSGILDDDKSISVMGGVAGSYSTGNNFVALIEHKTATKKGDDNKLAQDSRLRYFQVFDVQAMLAEQIGFSVDYVKSWKNSHDNAIGTDIVALGAIAKYQLTDKLSVFPNAAYVVGNASGNDGQKVDIKGFQTNLFGSYAINDTNYVVVQPQFQRVDLSQKGVSGAGELDTFKVKTAYGSALDSNAKWWLEASHTYFRNNATVELNGTELAGVDKDNLFELTVSYYF